MSTKRKNQNKKAHESKRNHPIEIKKLAERPKKIRQSKNVSKTIRNGTIIYTRDEYFEDNNGYRKPGYIGNNKLYRDAIVVDSNSDDELGLMKIHSGGEEEVVNKAGQIEFYSPHIKTKDDEGRPIKIGKKFQVGNEKYSVSGKDANRMKMKALGKDERSKKYEKYRVLSPKQKEIKQRQVKTRQQLQELKGRKKKNR